MRRLYDDFEEFDFADSATVGRILREQRREERRFASRRYHGPALEDRADDTEYYADYDDAEFDKYSGIRAD